MSASGTLPLHNSQSSELPRPNGVRDEESGLLNEKPNGSSPHTKKILRRILGKDRPPVSWADSLRAIVFSSWLNMLLIFLPFAWAAHLHKEWEENHGLVFALCFLTIIPLERLFDWGGEQMAMYCGEDLGDLIIITLNNAVEATLAIILLIKCELRLLQSTVVGVVLLHLLLIPGTGFLTGGARILQQHLDAHSVQLNHTLLIIGVMSLVVPLAFFTAMGRGIPSNLPGAIDVLSDEVRGEFLKMARGTAIILLVVYVCSRIYLHNPPGDNNALKVAPDAPIEERIKAEKLQEEVPEVNFYACVILLVISVALMGVTAEFLVESIEFVRESSGIREEWFGLVLLPLISFAADGTISVVFFIRSTLQHWLGKPAPPNTLAEDRAIDLSIQFTLFWLPFLVLLGWWTQKPFTLLFEIGVANTWADMFEVTVLVASCFLVNYVTADARTNWPEGVALIAFYAIIVLCAWFYEGQTEIAFFHACKKTIAEAIESGSPIEI
ncbi:hypothetical protein PENSPDRAFT_664752 [Peniophora sp. CONT]|nr:hypothetical protein PENSPDRAFT_664752 [Peniophora sp. CONT]